MQYVIDMWLKTRVVTRFMEKLENYTHCWCMPHREKSEASTHAEMIAGARHAATAGNWPVAWPRPNLRTVDLNGRMGT